MHHRLQHLLLLLLLLLLMQITPTPLLFGFPCPPWRIHPLFK
jgi:hypothetical protein